MFVKQRMRTVFTVSSLLILMFTVMLGVVLAVTSTTLVTPSNVGVDWFPNDTRAGGHGTFVSGPDTPPLGIGSFQMTTTDTQGGSSQAKAQLFNYSYIGASLADIDALSYWAYRSSGSTNPSAQTISLNIEVDFVGDGSSYTTLVFEPIYNGYQGAMLTDQWQLWDAYDDGNAVWWSTKTIPGICAFNCFVSWDTILTHNPDAKIKYGLGLNVGSGWVGDYSGTTDALSIGVAGNTTEYDFEPYKVATTKDDCKNGGWQTVKRADGSSFKNQGDCIQYVNTGK